MMKIFSPPKSVRVPEWDDYKDIKDPREWDKIDEQFLEALKEWAVNRGWRGKLTGEIIGFPVADGAAQYMVVHQPGATPSMALIHLPLHDAWHVDRITARGLTQKDVREMIDREKRVKALFTRSE